jgi:uncharacterized membrane protein
MLVALLLINAVFNIVVWPQFYRRISKDERARDAAGAPTAFLRVHLILITIALAIAAASAVAAVLSLIGVW